MKATAAVLDATDGQFQLEELDVAEPALGEVLVKLVATGVCHTDQVIREGTMPYRFPAVLGHEGAGVVEAVGAGVADVSEGDHVVLSFNSCGHCQPCLSGHPAYCDQFPALNFGGSRPDGTTALSRADGTPVSSHFFGQSSFASYAVASARSVVKVPADVPLEPLGPLGCGIQTGAGTVLNTLDPEPGSSIAIFGAGAVGNSALLAALVAGSTTIIAIDLSDERLALAERLGASYTVSGRADDVVERIREITGGAGVEYAIDTTGVPAVARQGLDSLAVQGEMALVAATASGTEISVEVGDSLLKGWRLSTVIEGDAVPQQLIPRLVDLWQDGQFPFDQLIETYPLDGINGAFDDSARGDTIKPVLTFT